MQVNDFIQKFGMREYKRLHTISEQYTDKGYVCGYADAGTQGILVAISPHARGRLHSRFGQGDACKLLRWFVKNIDCATDLREAVILVPKKGYIKMGLYTDKVDYGDMFMYIYFGSDEEDGLVEISTVVDFVTANGNIYFCDPEACPVWLKKNGRAVVGFNRIPKLRPSKNSKFGRRKSIVG